MKVLILNPPTKQRTTKEGRVIIPLNITFEVPRMPLSLSMVASIVRNFTDEVKILDCGIMRMSIEKLKKELKIFQPDYLIINTSSPTFYDDIKASEIGKDIGATVIVYGQHPQALPYETMKEANQVDIAITGEPEETLNELFYYIKNENDFSNVCGIAYRRDEKIYITNRRPFSDINKLPRPSMDIIDLNLYCLPDRERYCSILASRGCPYNCPFCLAPSMNGLVHRARETKDLINEIKTVKEQYGINTYLFQSDLFTYSKSWVRDMCEKIIDAKLKTRWICNSRVDSVDEDMLRIMRDAGCFLISFGLESGDYFMLKRLKQNTSPDQIEYIINFAHKLGIQTNGSFVIGYPGETNLSLKKTASLISKLPLEFAVLMCATPFPGTILYDQLKEKDAILPGGWDKFSFNNYCIRGELSPDEIYRFINNTLRKFYLRPLYIISRLKNFRNPRKAVNLMTYGLKRSMEIKNAFTNNT